jgi:hypothetical protein
MKRINTKSWRVRSICGGSVIALTAGVGLASGGFGLGGAFAADGPATTGTAPASSPAVSPAAGSTATSEKLVATYIEEGSANVALPASTLTAIDAVNKIPCPAAAGKTCTFVATTSIQESSSTGDVDNYIAEAAELDGNQFDGIGGPFFAAAPTDDSYAGGTWTETQTGVTPGKHKVQTFGYSEDGATAGFYTITYQVYEP